MGLLFVSGEDPGKDEDIVQQSSLIEVCNIFAGETFLLSGISANATRYFLILVKVKQFKWCNSR